MPCRKWATAFRVARPCLRAEWMPSAVSGKTMPAVLDPNMCLSVAESDA